MIYYYKIKYFFYTNNVKEILYFLPAVEKFDYFLLKLLFEFKNEKVLNLLFEIYNFEDVIDEEMGWLFSKVMDTKNVNIIDSFLALNRDVMTTNNIHRILRDKVIFKKLFKPEYVNNSFLDLAIGNYEPEIFDEIIQYVTPNMITTNTLIHVSFMRKNRVEIFDKLITKCNPDVIDSSLLYSFISTMNMTLIKKVLYLIGPNKIQYINENHPYLSVQRIASEVAPFIPELSTLTKIDTDNIDYLINTKNIKRIIELIPNSNFDLSVIFNLIRLKDLELFKTILQNYQFTMEELQRITCVVVYEELEEFLDQMLSIGVVLNSDILNDTIQKKNVKIFNKIFNENIINTGSLYTAVCFYQREIIKKIFEYPHLVNWQSIEIIIRKKYIHLLKKIEPYITVTKLITICAFESNSKRIIDIILSKDVTFITAELLCKLIYTTKNAKLVNYIYKKYSLKVFSNELIVLLIQKGSFDVLNEVFKNNEIDTYILNYAIRFFPYNRICRNCNWVKKINSNRKVMNLLLHQNSVIKKYIDIPFFTNEITKYL